MNGNAPVLTFPSTDGVARVNIVAIRLDPVTEMKAEIVVVDGMNGEEYTEPSVETLPDENGTIFYVPIAKVVVKKTSADGQFIEEVIDIARHRSVIPASVLLA